MLLRRIHQRHQLGASRFEELQRHGPQQSQTRYDPGHALESGTHPFLKGETLQRALKYVLPLSHAQQPMQTPFVPGASAPRTSLFGRTVTPIQHTRCSQDTVN